jgi:hypothetical protein
MAINFGVTFCNNLPNKGGHHKRSKQDILRRLKTWAREEYQKKKSYFKKFKGGGFIHLLTLGLLFSI